MGRRPTACEKCAAIKAKCTGHHPCSRCQRLSLPCSFTKARPDASPETATAAVAAITTATATELSPPSDHRVKRARHTKSSTGCANCRRRRKKCDERRPVCGDCDRLQLQCLPRPEASNFCGPPYASGATPEMILDQHGNSADGDYSGSDEDDAEDGATPGLDWLDIIDKENSADSSSRASDLAHSSALKVLPDKRAREITDLAHSSALKVLPDRRAREIMPPHEGLNEGIVLPPIVLTNYAGVDAAALDGWTPGERHLFNHFLQSVARSMSMVKDEYNPFIRLIVPMAFESKGVRNALAALSATHLSKTYPDFERNHLLHRNMALDDLKWRLESPETVIAALTATLLLCLAEICECRSRRWLLYLYGARALLEQVPPTCEQHPLTDFLIDLFNYICCVGGVTTDNVPRPWGKKFGLHVTSPDGTHALFGCEPDLYKCLLRINRMSHKVPHGAPQAMETIDSDTWKDKALAIVAKLKNWATLRDIDSEEKAAGCAVRWGIVLRARLLAFPTLDIAEPEIQGPVNNINTALSLIRPGSRAESRLLFPMYMAGLASITKASRLTIEYRVDVAEKTNGFGSVTAAHHIFDEVWQKYINEMDVTMLRDQGQKAQEKVSGLMLF